MEVTRPLLLRLFYQVKWPITPNESAGSVHNQSISRCLCRPKFWFEIFSNPPIFNAKIQNILLLLFHPQLGNSINLIPTGADYAHHITACPLPPSGFANLMASLIHDVKITSTDFPTIIHMNHFNQPFPTIVQSKSGKTKIQFQMSKEIRKENMRLSFVMRTISY